MRVHDHECRDEHSSAALDISPSNEIRCSHLDRAMQAASEPCYFMNFPTEQKEEEEEVGVSHRLSQTWFRTGVM